MARTFDGRIIDTSGYLGQLQVDCGCGEMLLLRRHRQVYTCAGCGRRYRRVIEQNIEIDPCSEPDPAPNVGASSV
ncbi:MAG TPA: hypothetical protein VG370_34775 [Chloroflexota bacterium]|nr:hypothetical protein [Chloroflexota bacterium]